MGEVLVVNPKLESNARKYLEWRPPILTREMNRELGQLEGPPLTVLIASILRSSLDARGQKEWVHRIARDLGLKDMPLGFGGGPQSSASFGFGWNSRMYGRLVEMCEAGELDLYLESHYKVFYIPLSSHFFFKVTSPFNLLNWNENPMEVKE